MQKLSLILVLIVTAAVALADEPPPIVNGGGATLKSLVGGDKLVTVVLKETGATDSNLRVVDVGPNYFAVLGLNNERIPYLFSSVAEVRVQDGRMETRKFTIDESHSLKIEEQKVVERAYERAREIFDAANSNQGLKIRAAVYLTLNNKKEAHEYLRRLATSNDLDTELDAALRLYLVGDTELDSPLIAQGLESGDRKVKMKAAKLAGFTGDKSAIPVLAKMAQDRAADICAPAARALGRMGYREIIPALMKMLVELNDEKGKAAIFALTRLGGPDVIEQVKAKLKTETGQMQYRLVLLLYKLGDPLGKELLIKQMQQYPTLAPEAALVLAREGEFDAVQFLSNRLKRRYDHEEPTLLFRANAAASLVQGADPAAVSHLQELLRIDNSAVRKAICTLIAETGKRRLIPILQPTLESANADIALQACGAVIAIAKPDFRERLMEWQN